MNFKISFLDEANRKTMKRMSIEKGKVVSYDNSVEASSTSEAEGDDFTKAIKQTFKKLEVYRTKESK